MGWSKLKTWLASRIVSIGALASIIGAIVNVSRVFLTDHGFALWGLGEPDLWLSIPFFLFGFGLLGVLDLHTPKIAKRASIASASGAFYGIGVAILGFGNPTGAVNIIVTLLAVSAYCLWVRGISYVSIISIILSIVSLCSAIPYGMRIK